MYCIYNNKDRTKTVALTFYRSELLNDLDQYGFVEGDTQKGSGEQKELEHLDHGKHQTLDITQEGNIDIVTRKLDLKFAWCRETLFPYTKEPVTDGLALDDVLSNPDAYTITMTVPDDFSDTTAKWLEQLIHNLLVWWALYYWLSMTKPEAADKWLALAKDAETELEKSKSRLCGRLKRPLRPF